MSTKILETPLFYCKSISNFNSLQLKQFMPQHGTDGLKKYLIKYARKHEEQGIERTYIVCDSQTDAMAGWFSLQTSTLPYQSKKDSFHIPALELTNFAVDERYRINHKEEFKKCSIGMYIYFDFIEPLAYTISRIAGCQSIYVFALNQKKLLQYYKDKLGFQEFDKDGDDIIRLPNSKYCEGLVYLYQNLSDNKYGFPKLKKL